MGDLGALKQGKSITGLLKQGKSITGLLKQGKSITGLLKPPLSLVWTYRVSKKRGAKNIT